MERSRSLVLLSIAILLPAFSQETGPKITLRTDAFQVSFPGKPSHQQLASDSGHVHVEQHAYSYENAASKFILSYARLSPAPVDLKPGDALDSAISGTVENVTGKLAAAKPTVIQGKPAKSVTITVGENTVIDGQFIYVKPRVYQLLVQHRKDAKPHFEQQFFDSFALRVTFAFAQPQTSSWKEYIFAGDGFAITLPAEPTPHSDPTLPEFTVYSVSFSANASMSLRVPQHNRDCTATLAQLREGALKGKSGIDPSSVKDPSIEGNQGLEYEYRRAERIASDRFYCVNGKFYAFSMSWQGTRARPEAVTRAVNSFHLLKHGS